VVLLNDFSQFIKRTATVSTFGILHYDIINSGRGGNRLPRKFRNQLPGCTMS